MRNGFEMDFYSYRFLKQGLFTPELPLFEGQYAKRIFVVRGNVSSRRELNLAAIKKALSPLGFSFISMDGKSMQQEANIFGNADVIISVHGSALHNTLFSRPGTKVIEIFAYDYFESSNYVIANQSACDYYYLIGEPISDTTENITFGERNKANVVVDIDKLLKLCSLAKVSSVGFL